MFSEQETYTGSAEEQRKAGLGHFRFHDLRHTFGSLLIEAGIPLPYVRDQMGHSSIQVTADKYVHLVARRNLHFIDRLDTPKTTQPDATQAQPKRTIRCPARTLKRQQVIEKQGWCERGDSNPHPLRDQILSLARLPIPPLSHWPIILDSMRGCALFGEVRLLHARLKIGITGRGRGRARNQVLESAPYSPSQFRRPGSHPDGPGRGRKKHGKCEESE
jgi:hypothetical protein